MDAALELQQGPADHTAAILADLGMDLPFVHNLHCYMCEGGWNHTVREEGGEIEGREGGGAPLASQNAQAAGRKGEARRRGRNGDEEG